ncbi:MAG: TadE/TadG family type IV pilus assembly protein [Aeromicrobium erythreum]
MPTRSARRRTDARSSRRRRGRSERGTSALEFSIIAPVFLLLIFSIIQTGLYLYARNTAQSAAREGVSYLRLAGNNSDPQRFRAAAEQLTVSYATKIGRLDDVTAVGTIDTETGRVTMLVTGTATLPLGGDVEVQQSSQATLEQFRGDLR